MLIKKSSIGLKTIVLILIAVVITLFIIATKDLKIAREDTLQYLMSMDLGFSSRLRLVDDGSKEFHNQDEVASRSASEYTKIINLATIKSIPEIIKYKASINNNFERVDIDIKYLEYQKILNDRSRALETGKTRNPTKVSAVLKYKGKKYEANLRLKGDLYGHWLSQRRMSFRVELKNKKSIFGYTKFSLQKPREREYPYDDVFQKMNRNIGNLSSNYKYIHLYVNGDNWGIMSLEEHVSKEFLEKQSRKDSPIIRFNNEKFWFYRLHSGMNGINPYSGYRVSSNPFHVSFYNSQAYLKDKQNRKILSYISRGYRNSDSSLYDIDSFSRAFILSTFWGSFHPLVDTNSKYYFNPYTLKVEPIALDSGPFWILNDPQDIPFHPLISEQYSSVLSTQYHLDSFDKNLRYVSDAILNVQSYFDDMHQLFPVDKGINSQIIINNMTKVFRNKKKYSLLAPPSGALPIRSLCASPCKSVDYPKPTKQQASEFEEHLYARHYTNGTLELHNLLPDNVTVKNILFNGKPIPIKDAVVPSYLSHPEPTVIKTPYEGIQDGMFTVNTEYQGFDRVVNNDITLVSNGIDNPLLLDTANEFDFINKLDGNTYEIKQGNWTVNKPIIVNGDLHISPGVSMQFSKDAYIVVKGSLTAIGGEASPIILKAISDSWKGIYVLNADKKSNLKNVSISNLSALEDELLKLTGGITFYKSDVDIENVRINNVKAEDAINIVESSFSLNSVFIDNTVSDGLDSDFSKGSVLHSKLSNIGGDALDFSGSKVSIENTKANNVKDKAVSAGEKSALNINNSHFNNIGVGVASKDGSSVSISNTTILDYKLYAAMSYIKKDFYAAPIIIVNNCSVSDGNAYIRQKGTSMIVDNIEIPESEINVENL